MSAASRSRLYFLDNVRWIMIARVAVFHVAAGYSALPEYFYETQAGGAIAMFGDALDVLAGTPVLPLPRPRPIPAGIFGAIGAFATL